MSLAGAMVPSPMAVTSATEPSGASVPVAVQGTHHISPMYGSCSPWRVLRSPPGKISSQPPDHQSSNHAP